ncbi:MAG: tryptophan synthase subunit alpha [Desulfopila sp.]|jgi:tryptophan synthase alpha chain|nr:tryptophan synthase subunit alpha [Desulfopila sp.]
MLLEDQLKKKLQEKDILLMTHIVLGYPSFEENREVVRLMVENGVDCIEMQIPFSEPMADGPVIMKANLDSLANGTKVRDCMSFGAEMAQTYDIPFLYMTYYNIIFTYGEEKFLSDCAAAGIQGLIIPDLPPEQSSDFFRSAVEKAIAPILIYSPTSTDERMKDLDQAGRGFIYCVARRGVTGKKSTLDTDFDTYIKRCRRATQKPVAVGFGIRSKEDIDALKGKADMAIIGSATIRLVDSDGAAAVGPFIAQLRR